MPSAVSTIIRLFREAGGDYISGTAISRETGITRSAVWKHITALRETGYIIDAVPSRGYRLASVPDILSEEEIRNSLDTTVFGSRLVCLETTASTNAAAFRLAEEGAPEGCVVVADTQSAGKGRLGRVWLSPPSVNLYCSVVLRPPVMPHQAPQLTFLSAVATVRAITRTTALAPEIKWPNDVIINGRKVAGLLNEMSAETDGINFVILGIGVNLNMTGDQFPPDLRTPGTSLKIESGCAVNRAFFAACLLNELDLLYREFLEQGFEPVRAAWQQHCTARGRMVSVSNGGSEEFRGHFAGVDSDGAMLLALPDGRLQRVLCGDAKVI